MHTTSALSDRAREVLGSVLEEDEDVLAWERADHLRDISEAPGGSGYTFLGITTRRMLWTSFLRPGEPEHLWFSEISAWASGSYLQRWIVVLRHSSGGESIFGFSRAGTAAARSLRARLEDLGVGQDPPLTFHPGTRADRTAGSVSMLWLVDG